jgi:hypothetical protein
VLGGAPPSKMKQGHGTNTENWKRGPVNVTRSGGHRSHGQEAGHPGQLVDDVV